MQITSIRVSPIENPESSVKAVVSVLINGQLMLRSIRIIERESGLVVVNPSRKNNAGRYVAYFRLRPRHIKAFPQTKLLQALRVSGLQAP